MKRTILTLAAISAFVFATAWLKHGPNSDPSVANAADTPAPVPNQTAGPPSAYVAPGFFAGDEGLSDTERAGRHIWYFATAGNSRFYAYTFPQRVGVLIDWHRVLRADQHDDRFKAWGLINDPGCCAPGSTNCPAKGLDETYGFEYCAGDDVLLQFVGKQGYRDPACDFKDAALDPKDIHSKDGKLDQRHSACDLAFGTSTGALGIRKFPNPRFDKEKWLKLNGSLASWDGYNKKLSQDGQHSDSRVSRLADGAVEPPFLIGTSCGSCHIAFDPLRPPADPANPKWENIKGTVGNQYSRMSEMLTSGMPMDSLEWQVFSHARPGTNDTSAIATDQVNNPGTINALINLAQRPTFSGEEVSRWRKVAACAAGAPEETCWCEPGRDGKCWEKKLEKENGVHHILKGGEDSIGKLEAIQRVYFNIGSCSEQCWVNHFSDLRQLDSQQRNFGQTPFDIGQCRRDCPNFRAVEDRLPDIFGFLASKEGHATDLQVARANAKSNPSYAYESLLADLETEFGKGAVARGSTVFAENCARCHSSIPETVGNEFKNRDFRKIAANGMREDWLGNDQPTKATEVGTYRCRALHSNHLVGHIYQQYGSETLRKQTPDPNIKEGHDGGRGYYRNISLLNLWAHAPLLHNNSVGPELCGQPSNKTNDFYRLRYVDPSAANFPLLAEGKQPACWPFDPSVDGRYKLYVESMRQLLNPDTRGKKITRFNFPVVLDFGPKLWDGKEEKQIMGLKLEIPAGTAAGTLGNFQHKLFVNDLVMAKLDRGTLQKKLSEQLGDADGKALTQTLVDTLEQIIKDPANMIAAVGKNPKILEAYSSCTAEIENEGHRFGESLPAADKNALIAFLATL